MVNRAAIIPSAKAPLEIRNIELYTPGPDEILVKNQALAFNPFEMKIAKRSIMPIQYPAILGSSFAGVVDAVGPGVTRFNIGDRVAVSRGANALENRYGSYQRYVVAKTETVSKISTGIDLAIAASMVGNLSTVVGLFNGSAKLDRPELETPATKKGKKILIYGGSSSFGSLSVQYIARAGYEVVTTTSLAHKNFVHKLGASKIIDHTQPHADIVKALIAEGPYELVVDAISGMDTMRINADVVAAQGGERVYAMQPAFGPETLPDGVARDYQAWRTSLDKEGNEGLLEWAFDIFFPQTIGKLTPIAVEKISGGLEGANEALGKLYRGVSGVKLVADPWE
jgi:NADPH:quinone reductase-like Zn-dependent oxidoreductase